MKRHHGWLAVAATVPLLTLAACSGSASPPSASSQSQPANAVGAAIASVSGQVDRIFHYGEEGRRAILEEAQDEARERAVAAGADPGAVQIIEVEEIPLAYLTTPAARVRVKAAGTLGG